MIVHRLLLMIAMAAFALLLAACGNEPVGGPPAIRYGQDVCSECGMIISDERFACAIVPDEAAQAPLLFDDIGCLLDYEQAHQATAGKRYFHDALARYWIAVDRVFFVNTDQQTPMGSGLFALEEAGEAQKLATARKDGAGKVRDYSQLRRTAAAQSNE